MLTEKDYCDYKTCVALKEMGYKGMSRYYYTQRDHKLHYDAYAKFYTVRTADAMGYVLAIHLYEAQKWLREEKKIITEATFNLMYKGQPRFSWRVLYNLTQHKGAYYTFDSAQSKEDYDFFEEALSEGIKEAVKILTNNKNE